MNKRIQKKIAKRLEHDAELAADEAAAVSGESALKDSLALVRKGAQRVKQAFKERDAGKAVRAVQEGASEAIGQVKDRVARAKENAKEKLHETEQLVKDKLEETEQRAEALLEKVPVVGAAAKKKLHGLTHP